MHEFLKGKLELGKPHPPWKDIWDQASNCTPLSGHSGGVYDGATGRTYKDVGHFLEATRRLPFAMGDDGRPDFDHALSYWRIPPWHAK